MNLVTEGLGVSVLPELLLEHCPHSATALPLDPPQWRMLGLGVPQEQSISPMTRNFIQYVERYVKGLG